MIYARCTICGQTWNVAIGQKFPKGGYICPRCESKRKDNRHESERQKNSRPPIWKLVGQR